MNTELRILPPVSPTENFGKWETHGKDMQQWETHGKDMQQRERTIKIALFIFAAIATAACLVVAIACPILIPVYGVIGLIFGLIGAISIPVITTGTLIVIDMRSSQKYSELETAQNVCYSLTCPGTLLDYIDRNTEKMWYSHQEWNALEKHGYLPAHIIKDSKKIEEEASSLITTIASLRYDLRNIGMVLGDQEKIKQRIQKHQARLEVLSIEWEKKKKIFRQELPYAVAAPPENEST